MKPTVANCPKCGARFNNTMGGMMANMHDRMGNPSGGMPPPGFNPPSTAPSPPFMTSPAPPMMPPAPVPPPVPVPEMSTPPLPAPDTPTSDSTNNTPTATSQGFGANSLLAVGILGGGLLVLIGALAAILYLRRQAHVKPRNDVGNGSTMMMIEGGNKTGPRSGVLWRRTSRSAGFCRWLTWRSAAHRTPDSAF